MIGILFAKGRKTITSWFKAAGIIRQYKAFYYFSGAMRRKTETIATVLFEIMINCIYQKQNWFLIALDDTTTKRYGPKVQGTGIHLNPITTPDGTKLIYGHLWIVLSALVRHKHWELLACLFWLKCISEPRMSIGCKGLDFKLKLQQTAELVKWSLRKAKIILRVSVST